jgi:hypothetical protein
MRKKIKLSVGPGIEVEEIELRDGRWVLSARAAAFCLREGRASCADTCSKEANATELRKPSNMILRAFPRCPVALIEARAGPEAFRACFIFSRRRPRQFFQASGDSDAHKRCFCATSGPSHDCVRRAFNRLIEFLLVTPPTPSQ